ncbi:hypothetical protein Pelo_921 [Pelomyxa schiedti]|nr:hypothetical protein Pelo_921 [Pelomyxa schiedti]
MVGVVGLLVVSLLLVASLSASPSLYNGATNDQAYSFWTIADIHIASDYAVGSDPKTFCTNGTGTAGKIGAYNCDSTFSLFQSALDFMVKHDITPSFLLWVGDSATLYQEHPAHYETWPMIWKDIIQVVDYLKQYFPTTPIFPVIGNHDYHPASELPPPDVVPGYFIELANLWSSWLSPESLVNVRRGGFYEELVFPGLHIVVLNTLYFLNGNPWVINSTVLDIGGQLQWFESVLQTAKLNGEQVLIVGHAPPGSKNPYDDYRLWTADYENEYFRIVTEYPDVIMGQIFGHLHSDAFRLVPSVDSQVVFPAFISPGLTPRCSSVAPDSGQTEGKNPALRSFSLVDDNLNGKYSWKLADYESYWLDLEEANEHYNSVSYMWKLLYDPLKEYQMTDLSSASMVRLANQLISNQTLWCKFFDNWFVRRTYTECDSVCRQKELCNIMYSSYEAYSQCLLRTDIPSFHC